MSSTCPDSSQRPVPNWRNPGQNPFTRQELQAFFDRADDEVDRIATLGRKGWLPGTVTSCLQADVDAWLANGPTTRHAIRTFFVWAVKNRTCANITIGFRQTKTVPLLTQAQRLTMLKARLTDNIDTLSYRVATTLLLLYAQPVVKIAGLKSTDVILTPDGPRLSLGEEHPAPVPEPFASLLITHLASRPNMRREKRTR